MPCPREQANRCLAAAGAALEQAHTSLDFDAIAVPPAQRWQGDSRSGLQAPIGMDSTGAVHRFSLGHGLVHHGLIGGTTGSGKSDLLHVIITQLALTYAPDELELYLVDSARALEFKLSGIARTTRGRLGERTGIRPEHFAAAAGRDRGTGPSVSHGGRPQTLQDHRNVAGRALSAFC